MQTRDREKIAKIVLFVLEKCVLFLLVVLAVFCVNRNQGHTLTSHNVGEIATRIQENTNLTAMLCELVGIEPKFCFTNTWEDVFQNPELGTSSLLHQHQFNISK